MSRNQKHAVELALRLCRGDVEPALISEVDWSLLLLAAGLNNASTGPLAVAKGVIARFRQKVGYFAGYIERGSMTMGSDQEPNTAA